MQKDINFYRECLKKELIKPFNKQDSMYLIHLDKIIYNIINIVIILHYTILPLEKRGLTLGH